MRRRRATPAARAGLPVELEYLERLFLAPLLGLTAAAMVGLLRGFGPLRRLRLWALLTGFSGGAFLAIRDSGLPYEGTLLQIFAAIFALAGAGALLRFFDLMFWDWFLSRRRHVNVPRLLVDLFKLLTM